MATGPVTPENMLGLDGLPTSVQLTATGGIGLAGGFAWSGNTGDYRALLNDVATIGTEIQYHFNGVRPGKYLIYCYAVDPIGFSLPVDVSVPGSSTPNPQLVTGPMPGNAFVLGVTHSLHELDLIGTSFEIIARNHTPGPPSGSVNGFQIVAVPEPGTVTCALAGLALYLARRRKSV